MENYDKLIKNIITNKGKEEMSDTKTVRSGGISFCGLLTIVFIALKLAKIGVVANWSWLWVLSPLWIPIALVFIVLILLGLVMAILDR